jgi:replicative DNA helicase Mcm
MMEFPVIKERFEEFFRCFYEKEILEAVRKGRKGVEIDFSTLDKFDPELADMLLNNPEVVIEAARKALNSIDVPKDEDFELIPRFKNLPESSFIRIRSIRKEHLGKLIVVDGIVRRASEVKPEVEKAYYRCPTCKRLIEVVQKERVLKGPERCACGRKSGFVLEEKDLVDARWIVIEEPFEVVTGDRPGQIAVHLTEDLVTPEMQRKTDPGNRVKVVGILKELQRSYRGKTKTQIDFYLEAVYVEPTEIEWEEIEITPEDVKKILELSKDENLFEKFKKSIAPSIYGMDVVKEAILLQMFGGVAHRNPDGTRVRGDIHILLIGDPSVAKSQLLKYVAQIVPRAKYVSGKGTTAAGLTATVIRDDEFMGGWVLEAGAVVLCNKSIICIDEFDKISKEDQSALHEAMEQQTISIAKANIVASLPAEVAVLAAANPRYSRFDPYKPIADQINIPETLLSRFDLKFALRDVPDVEKDKALVEHVINLRLNPEIAEPEIPVDLMRKYIAYARKHCKPKMTKEALEELSKFFIEMRAVSAESGGESVAITLRQMEALMRLAEASAKVRLSEKVEVEDARRAIRIMKASLDQLAFDYETGTYDIDRTYGTPASRRSKIREIVSIVEDLQAKIGDVPVEDVIEVAKERGIEDAQEIIERLKRDGLLFEPRPGFVRKV